eukprot:TRINITY_DN10975_c0_g2_i2.p1 TRINITY_DN10975_c0_g2~~TRINITY_DN10975_c0_g2_i2.p1  ORF type:complete len:1929 (+),score=350.56 TRINITY_DN10975_c0_g2_i2:60-5846(+)
MAKLPFWSLLLVILQQSGFHVAAQPREAVFIGTAPGLSSWVVVGNKIQTPDGRLVDFDEVPPEIFDSTPINLVTSLALDPRNPRYRQGQDMMNAWTIFCQRMKLRGGMRVMGNQYSVSVVVLDDSEGGIGKFDIANYHPCLVIGPWTEDDVQSLAAKTKWRPDIIAVTAGTGDHSGMSNVFSLRENHRREILLMMMTSVKGAVTRVTTLVQAGYEEHCNGRESIAGNLGMSAPTQATFNLSPTQTDADLANIFQAVKLRNADGLLICADDTMVARCLETANTLQFNPGATLLPATDLRPFARKYGSRLAKWLIAADCWDESHNYYINKMGSRAYTERQQFVQDYKNRFLALPSHDAAIAYAAAEIAVQAAENTVFELVPDSAETSMFNFFAAVTDVLSKSSVETVAGTVDLASGATACVAIQTQADGEPVVIHPESVREAALIYPSPDPRAWRCTTDPASQDEDVPPWSSWGFNAAGQCISCPRGQESRFFKSLQRRVCTTCEAGKTFFDRGIDAAHCELNCPAGFAEEVAFIGETYEAECKPCSAGTFLKKTESGAKCHQCPGGRTSEPAATACYSCLKGKFSMDGQTMNGCLNCSPGKMSAFEGSTSCQDCESGKYAPESNATECIFCLPGRVANATGRTECTKCEPGHFEVNGGKLCQACPAGKYQQNYGKTECIEAGAGQAAAKPGQEFPINAPNFFFYITNAMDGDDDLIVQVEQCVYRPEACLENERCAKGTTGRQCFSCMPGYSSGASCFQCPNHIVNVVLFAISGLCHFAVYTLFAILVLNKAGNTKDAHHILLKILLNHCIAMTVIASSLDKAVTRLNLGLSPAMGFLLNWGIRSSDGSFAALEAPSFSVACLLQPHITDAGARHIEALEAATHSGYFSDALKASREWLFNYQWNTEMRMIVFWNTIPFVLILMAAIPSFLWLTRFMAEDGDEWAIAMEFYAKVYFFGWKQTANLYKDDNFFKNEMLRMYQKSVLGICWPVQHADAWVKKRYILKIERKQKNEAPQESSCTSCTWLLRKLCLPVSDLLEPYTYRRINFKLFFIDVITLSVPMLYVMYFSVARVAARASDCVHLGPDGDHSSVVYSQGVLDCSIDGGIHWVSFGAALMWSIGFPALCVWDGFSNIKKILAGYRHEMRIHAVFVNGYRRMFSWWEVVVCSRKAMFLIIEFVPMDERIRFFAYFVVGLTSIALQITCSPYDARWGGILNKMEQYHLFCVALVAMAANTAMMSKSDSFLIVTIIVGSILNVGVVVMLLWNILMTWSYSYATSLDPKQVFSQREGLVRWYQVKALQWQEFRESRQPYLAYDCNHGFVSLVGNNGNDPVPPHILCGRELPQARRDDRSVLSMLSEVPAVPVHVELGQEQQAFKLPSKTDRLAVQEQLMYTVLHVQNIMGAIFSATTVLDFILRGLFVSITARTQEMKNEAQEVDRDLLSEENDDDDDEADEVLTHDEWIMMQTGRELQEDLRKFSSLGSIAEKWEAYHVCQMVKKQMASGGMPALEDFEHAKQEIERIRLESMKKKKKRGWKYKEESETEDEGEQVRSADDTADKEVQDKHLRAKIHKMFTPALFKSGCSFLEMEQGLYDLRGIPGPELKRWVELFERQFWQEKNASTKALNRACGRDRDMEVQANEEDINAANTQLADERQNVKTLGGYSLDVSLKWTKLIWQMCIHSGIVQFPVSDVLKQRASREIKPADIQADRPSDSGAGRSGEVSLESGAGRTTDLDKPRPMRRQTSDSDENVEDMNRGSPQPNDGSWSHSILAHFFETGSDEGGDEEVQGNEAAQETREERANHVLDAMLEVPHPPKPKLSAKQLAQAEEPDFVLHWSESWRTVLRRLRQGKRPEDFRVLDVHSDAVDPFNKPPSRDKFPLRFFPAAVKPIETVEPEMQSLEKRIEFALSVDMDAVLGIDDGPAMGNSL